eukprot:7118480-Prymnesium_polylepis.2
MHEIGPAYRWIGVSGRCAAESVESEGAAQSTVDGLSCSNVATAYSWREARRRSARGCRARREARR